MFSLRKKIGCHKLCIALRIGYYADLRRTCRHIYCHLMKRHMLFGSHNILVAWAEYLVHLGHRLRTVCHCTDSLHTTYLEHLFYAHHICGSQDCRVHLAIGHRRCAEHYLATTSYLGWSGKHQNCGEKRSRAARYIQSHTLYGQLLLPTHHAWCSLNFADRHELGLMKLIDIVMGKLYGFK